MVKSKEIFSIFDQMLLFLKQLNNLIYLISNYLYLRRHGKGK